MPEPETRAFRYVSTQQLLDGLPYEVRVPDLPDKVRFGHTYAAIDDDFRSPKLTEIPSWSRAPATDVKRWREATRTLLARFSEINSERDTAKRELAPSKYGILRRVMWTIRHRALPSQKRRRYQALCDRLKGEAAAAYRSFDERAADLTEHVERAQQAERERKRLAEERLRQERAEQRNRERELRAMALGGPEDPVWACGVKDRSGDRRFTIWLPALGEVPTDRQNEPMLLNVTAREIQAAINRERSGHPYTSVTWAYETERALRERQHDEFGDDMTTWEELTGERFEMYPQRPGENHKSGNTRAYGPSSSDYGSGGTHHGGYHPASGCGSSGFSCGTSF